MSAAFLASKGCFCTQTCFGHEVFNWQFGCGLCTAPKAECCSTLSLRASKTPRLSSQGWFSESLSQGEKGALWFWFSCCDPKAAPGHLLSSGPKSSRSNPATFMLLNSLTFLNTDSWLYQLLDPGQGLCGSMAAGQSHRWVGDTKSLCPGASPCAPVTRLLTLSCASRSRAWKS